MIDAFHAGEIAIAVCPPDATRNRHMDGQEVEVLTELSMQYTANGNYMGYLIQCSIGVYSVRPQDLRKKRPPQDSTFVKWHRALKREFGVKEPEHV